MYSCKILFLLLFPANVWAETVSEGEKLFALHCAACHGETAQGEGPVAQSIAANPLDLTLIARRNSGNFPTREIIAKIDGRSPVEGHGGAMPVYGYFFEGPLATINHEDSAQLKTTEPIAAIVRWLMSVQK